MVFFLKRRLISRNIVTEKKQNNCWGLTLRQWALLDSMLIFVRQLFRCCGNSFVLLQTITAVITMCSILGYIHSKEVITILNDDIREEMTESDGYYDQGHGNHAILYLSVDKVLSKHIDCCIKNLLM